MKFTIENQKGNRISRTTNQKIQHFIYSNNEVSICGLNGSHDVWLKRGTRMSQKVNGLSLVDAVSFANSLMSSI